MGRTMDVDLPLERGATTAPELTDRPGRSWRWLVLLVSRVVLVAALLALWQYAAGRWIDPFWVSSPAEVWAELQRLAFKGDTLGPVLVNFPSTDLAYHLKFTFEEMVLGLAYGTASATVVGFILGRARFIGDLLNPLIIALYSLPRLALAPLFILWFGIGTESKVVFSAVIVFFLVFYNTFTGAREVDQDLIDTVRVFGANRLQVLLKIVVPSALTWVFAGIRLAVPYALVGAVVGEMMAGNRGLGYLVSAAANQFDTGGIFAALVVLMIVSLCINELVARAEGSLLRWKVTSR